MTEHSQVIEEYLLTLYKLNRAGDLAKAVTLAKRLDTSPPTVHATISRMQRDGLVEVKKSKELVLTKEGQKIAEDIAYRHNLSEYFLCNTLGIPWYEVHQHAHRLEHAMTPIVVQKLAEFLGKPEFCPHGTPMPGTNLPENTITLMESKPGTTVEIAMIGEALEDSVDLMKILHEHRIMPGNLHKVLEKTEVMRTVSLESKDGTSSLPFHVAEKIFVLEVPKD
ncbi:MAG: metal-dependent transcriptional regulator [SAR324 cluster bacterium]|nr:metal-dependent transcriptional regulator [SAR324 cluster bacterium]MBL7034343.1 metal-dependent transcriptional regulator [SAR324 cluster bacterium]